MEQKYFGLFPVPTPAQLSEGEILVGIFENEDTARNHGRILTQPAKVKVLRLEDLPEITGQTWYNLNSKTNSSGEIWLLNCSQTASYVKERGYSRSQIKGQDVAKELGFIS